LLTITKSKERINNKWTINFNSKGHIKIFKDNGNGDIREVATSHDLHQKDIMVIQTQMISGNMIIITGGKDGTKSQ